MQQLFLPRYTIGKDALDSMKPIIEPYGKRVVLIYGEKAWKAAGDKVRAALQGFDISGMIMYGKEASWDNINKLVADETVRQADVLIGIGGGKCLDVVKTAGDQLKKPVFTVATIASTCASVTKISIIHNNDGSFKEVFRLKEPPVHCFIDTEIIFRAPRQYFWAGMGDTMAKHIECVFSAKNDVLDFASEYGRTISSLCYYPMIEKGAAAYNSIIKGEYSEDVEEIILSIIVATGSVSLAVNPDYNSAVAHALYYGLTVREWMERKHLHGEIVSYGTLIQLIVDKQWDKLKQTYEFNKSVGLPVRLADLDLTQDDPLDDVLEATVINPELYHVPYKVTKEMLREAIDYLEGYKG
ncbi:MAG: iron-containing alcohol dehydrogenase family protein [Erysipelotrichaceae bacterium]|nr:iron-containing alcohol dehydrogenase family protein [Erysipelotrichaceae bacterium]